MIPSSLPIILEADQGETTLFPENVSQVWKATGATTNGAVDVWVEIVPPRLGPPEHLHAHHDEFFWVVKGTFLVNVADRTVQVSEGASLFLPRGIAHAFQNVGTDTGHLLIATLPGGVMRAYFEELLLLFLSGSPDQQAISQVGAKYDVVFVGPALDG
ncbi:MAG: cupin domain-containing protein [Chloroflexi bacterium]|nr:cupin domain-containing protein [Chloroflexota bacterium]